MVNQAYKYLLYAHMEGDLKSFLNNDDYMWYMYSFWQVYGYDVPESCYAFFAFLREMHLWVFPYDPYVGVVYWNTFHTYKKNPFHMCISLLTICYKLIMLLFTIHILGMFTLQNDSRKHICYCPVVCLHIWYFETTFASYHYDAWLLEYLLQYDCNDAWYCSTYDDKHLHPLATYFVTDMYWCRQRNSICTWWLR